MTEIPPEGLDPILWELLDDADKAFMRSVEEVILTPMANADLSTLGSAGDLPLGFEPSFPNPAQDISDQIPSLAKALEDWRNGDENPLLSRTTALNLAQLQPFALKFMYQWLTDNDQTYLLLIHPPITSTLEKSAWLKEQSEGIQPITTVSLEMHPANHPVNVLITGVGHNLVDKDLRRVMANDLRLPMRLVKDARVNSTSWDPGLILGVSSGLVGPFIPPSVSMNFDRLYYLQNDTPPKTPVEVALSYIDSLVLQKGAFERMLGDYARYFVGEDFYTHVSQGRLSRIT